jgi:hypothetical protein
MATASVQSNPGETTASPPIQPDDGPSADADEEERDRVRIRAAMNIFDAEEIREPEAVNQSGPLPDT